MSTAKTAATATTTTTESEALPDVLSQIARATGLEDADEIKRAEGYFQEYLKQLVARQPVVANDVEATIKFWIAEIDKKLSAQLNEVLHHPEFQRLEGTWRGLHYLVSESETGEFLKLRVLNVTKDELRKDLERASEFDQSQLFKKVYEEEYGQLGGKPFGMLVGDYEFDYRSPDIAMLQKISGVAASAHAPFVAAASPKMFQMESFTQLPNPRDLGKIFESIEHTKWNEFRRDWEDSRYVALTMPRVLARLPYGGDFEPVEEFNFEEFVDGKSHDKYLWMNSAWAYAARITDAFAKYGWLARTRGVLGGGKVENLKIHYFPTDDGETVMKCPTEIAISDRRENELSGQGFLPLLHCKEGAYAAFIGAQSCQRPKKYHDPEANSNAELSAKFNMILNTSRFAHYLKVMVRDRIGMAMERKDLEVFLNDWIKNYVVPKPENVDEEEKARKPLAAARIEVRSVEGKPGWYEAVAHMRPHFQLEGLTTSMRLVAEIPKAAAR